MRLALLLSLSLLCAAPAGAQNWNCADPGNLPQQGMNYCAHQDWKAADAELNRVYKLARDRMREHDSTAGPGQGGAADALRDAQRAWIPFRDKACAAEGFLFRGGSMEPFIVASCMTGLTEQRIQGLRTLAENM